MQPKHTHAAPVAYLILESQHLLPVRLLSRFQKALRLDVSGSEPVNLGVALGPVGDLRRGGRLPRAEELVLSVSELRLQAADLHAELPVLLFQGVCKRAAHNWALTRLLLNVAATLVAAGAAAQRALQRTLLRFQLADLRPTLSYYQSPNQATARSSAEII